MKQLIKLTMPLAVALLLAACSNVEGNQKKQESHEGHNMATMENRQTAPKQAPEPMTIKDDRLNALYQHYVHLTTALTNGSVAKAKIASNAIEVGAKQLNISSAIAASAAKITTTSNIEQQRAAYEKLTNEMITLVDKAGVVNGELYVQFCPMAFNDKGAAWLSSTKEIRNPYFGKKMLNCGEVKKTIN